VAISAGEIAGRISPQTGPSRVAFRASTRNQSTWSSEERARPAQSGGRCERRMLRSSSLRLYAYISARLAFWPQLL